MPDTTPVPAAGAAHLPALASDAARAAIVEYLGHGFDLFESSTFKSILPTAIFDYSKCGTKKVTSGGVTYDIPSIVDFMPASSVDHQSGCHQTLVGIEETLAASVGIQGSYGLFNAGLKASFEKSSEYTADRLYAYRFTQVGLGTFTLDSQASEYFGDEFKSAIDTLPSTFTAANFPAFREFFNRFGVRYLTSFAAGGQLQMFNAVATTQSTSTQSGQADLNAQYEGLFVKGSFEASVTGSQSWKDFSKYSETVIKAQGGSMDSIAALTGVDPLSPSADTVSAYTGWVSSVATAAVPVQMGFSRISQLCGDKAAAVDQAAQAYAAGIYFRTVYQYIQTPPTDFPNHAIYGTVSINGTMVTPSNPPADPSTAYGFQAIVFAKDDPGTILHNKFYSYTPANWQTSYPDMYTAMYTDLSGANLQSENNIVILRSSNLLTRCYPSGDFYTYLLETLGISQDAFFNWRNLVMNSYPNELMDAYVVGQPLASAPGHRTGVMFIAGPEGSSSSPSVGPLLVKVTATVVNNRQGPVDLLSSWWS